MTGMKPKLLNRIRALETNIASTYVLPNVRIVFVSASGNRSCDYCLEGGRLVAVSDRQTKPEIASDNRS